MMTDRDEALSATLVVDVCGDAADAKISSSRVSIWELVANFHLC